MAPHDGAAHAEERSPLRLPNKIADSDPQKNQRIRKSIEEDVNRDSGLSIPCFLQNLSILTTLMPPHWKKLPPELKQFVEKEMFDPVMRQVLEDDNVINWAPSAIKLFPLITTGDGNCLLHAVSLAMWGIEDDNLFLRRLLHGALNGQDMESRRRWQRERKKQDETIPGSGLRYDTMEWRSEWEMIIQMASPERNTSNTHQCLPYQSLEEFHVYMLANILRRPIIVMAQRMWHDLQGNSLQPQNFSGVYLPLKWKPEECSKLPIILGYYQMHFVPLVYTGVMEGESSATDFVAPLIQQDHTPLPVHFLTEEEAGHEDQLVQEYLTVEELPHMDIDESMASAHNIKGAALSKETPPDDINLMTSYFKLVESHYRFYLETEYNPQGAFKGAVVPNRQLGGSAALIEDKMSKSNLNAQVPHGSDMWAPATNPNYESSVSSSNTQQGRASEELSRPQASSAAPERIMSMVNQSCKTKDCPFYRSISTGEYCHECYSKLKSAGEIKDAFGLAAKCRTEGCLNPSGPGKEHCQVCQASAKFQDNVGPVVGPSAPLPSNVLYPAQQAGNTVGGNQHTASSATLPSNASYPARQAAVGNTTSGDNQYPQARAYHNQSVHISGEDDLTTLMVNTQIVGSKKCVMPECQLTGHPTTSDMCQKCFDENRRIHEDVMTQAGTGRIERPQSQIPMTQNSAPIAGIYTTSISRQCKTPGCHGLANSQLGYYCGECALQTSPVMTVEKPNYPQAGVASPPSIPPPSYNLAMRILQSNQAAAQVAQSNQASGYTDPNQQAQIPNQHPQIAVLTVQKHICTTPGCQGIRLEGGYCHECVLKNRLQMPPARTQTPPSTPKHSWVQSKPRAQTPPMTSPRQLHSTGLGQLNRNPPSSPSSSAYGPPQHQAGTRTAPLSHPSTRTCRHPKCDRPAAPPKYILCEECIQIAELYKQGDDGEQQRGMQNTKPATWSGEEQVMQAQPKPSTSNRAVPPARAYIPRHKCQARGGCKDEMFGDPELNNLCSSCFKDSLLRPPFNKPVNVHSAPLRPSARMPQRQTSHSHVLPNPANRKPENQPQDRVFHMPQHTQAGFGNQVIIATGPSPATVQVGQVPYVQKCVTPDCPNQANPNILEGYCNHCYQAYEEVFVETGTSGTGSVIAQPGQPAPEHFYEAPPRQRAPEHNYEALPRQHAQENYYEEPRRGQAVPVPQQYQPPQPYPTRGQAAPEPRYQAPQPYPTGQTAKPYYNKPVDIPTPKPNRGPCKHSWCTNYGNPRCFGLCNECYKLTQLNRNGQIPQ